MVLVVGQVIKNKIIGMSNKHEKGYMPWDRTGNRILVKSQLGNNKPTNYEIPTPNFVYGKITADDPEHANDVMYQWKNHAMTDNQNHLKEKDMIETNKKALRNFLHTSSQFQGFRKGNTQYKGVKEGTNVIPIKLPEANHFYGKPLDLEDPIKLVIANNYGEEDKFVRHTVYANHSQVSSAPNRRLSCHITKNHNLVKDATAKRMAKFDWGRKTDHWKISKFREVNFKVETRRDRAQSIK